jgi:hypothetical protein
VLQPRCPLELEAFLRSLNPSTSKVGAHIFFLRKLGFFADFKKSLELRRIWDGVSWAHHRFFVLKGKILNGEMIVFW